MRYLATENAVSAGTTQMSQASHGAAGVPGVPGADASELWRAAGVPPLRSVPGLGCGAFEFGTSAPLCGPHAIRGLSPS